MTSINLANCQIVTHKQQNMRKNLDRDFPLFPSLFSYFKD